MVYTIRLLVITLTFIAINSCITLDFKNQNNLDYDSFISAAVLDLTGSKNRVVIADSVFFVDVIDLDNMLGVSIYAYRYSFYVEQGVEPDSLLFPTRYIRKGDKLFIWDDKEVALSKELIDVLVEFNKIDSVKSMKGINWLIDDDLETVDYFFCKKNLTLFKKVITKSVIGDYKPPKLKCK